MGQSSSNTVRPATGEAARRQNQLIERQLAEDGAASARVLKILLLGGPAAGKSTVFKQMRIQHSDGFGEGDRINFRYLIYANVFGAITALLDGCRQLNIEFDSTSTKCVTRVLSAVHGAKSQDLDEDSAAVIGELWKSAQVQQCFARRDQLCLPDSTKYFLDNVERLGRADFQPTDDDIVRARKPTALLEELQFDFGNVSLRLIDVGGQRSQRRKWIHLFDGVHGVLFVAALPDYDRVEHDDDDDDGGGGGGGGGGAGNALANSVATLASVVGSRAFGRRTAFVLFLNKMDVFAERVAQAPLAALYADYAGDSSAADSAAFLGRRFAAVVEPRTLYTHCTVATDARNVGRVFADCMHSVIRATMDKVAFV